MGPKRFKYSYEGKQWDPNVGRIKDRAYISAHTGTVFKQLQLEHGLAKFPGPMGSIGRKNADSNNRYLLPLLIHFRPFDQGVADLTDAEYTANAGTIGKTKCAIVRCKGAGGRFECWVDPARDYLVMRILKKQRRTDISYVRNKVVGWIPQSWSIRVMHSDGSLRVSKKATVRTNLTLLNSGVKKSDFDIVFPDATYVTDRSKAEIATYIARANGAHRIITREERRASIPYKVLIKTSGPKETLPGVLPKK